MPMEGVNPGKAPKMIPAKVPKKAASRLGNVNAVMMPLTM